MERIYKSESYLFFIAIILYLLTLKAGLPHIFYMFYSVLLAMFFFPTKIIIRQKSEPVFPMVVSTYVISWFLVYANIVHYMDEPGVIFQMFMFFTSLVNLFMLYYFYKKKNDSMALHLLAFAFIPMILFY